MEPSSGPTADEGLANTSGPRVPPRRNGSRVKKGASSGSYSSSCSVVASQPMAGGDDCAINDLLEGRTDLCLVLPDQRHIIVNVERRTPVMDLLVQVATAHKINPSNHTIQVSNERGSTCKPNTPVGSLDVRELFIVPKVSNTSSEIPHKRPPKRAPQPFEPTFRLQVRLPKNQLMVLRVNLGTTLGQVKQTVCEEKALDPQGYQLVAIGRLPVAPLELSLTLEQYGSTEVGLMSNRALAATIQNTATDLISYSMNKECKKGIIGLLTHHRSKGSLTGSSSDGVSSRGTSPVRIDPLCQTIGPPNNPPTVPSRTATKKRPAPPPPPVANQVQEESQVHEVAGSSNGEHKECTRTHSRQSSDSSGYHEASVLSDLPETPSPETVCSSSGACSLDSPPQSLEVTRPRRGARKPRPSSMASDASSGKKRRAPPPPPPPSSQSIQSPSSESSLENAEGTSPSVSQRVASVSTLTSPNEEGAEECSENDSVLSTPKGDFECGRAASPESPTNPTPRPRLTLQHKKGSLDLCESTKIPVSVVVDDSGISASDETNQHQSTIIMGQRSSQAETHGPAGEHEVPNDIGACSAKAMLEEPAASQPSWEYSIPEPPSPFRTCAPDYFDAKGATTTDIEIELDVNAANGLSAGTDREHCQHRDACDAETGRAEDAMEHAENEMKVCAVIEASSSMPSSDEPMCATIGNSKTEPPSSPVSFSFSEGAECTKLFRGPGTELGKDAVDGQKLCLAGDASVKLYAEQQTEAVLAESQGTFSGTKNAVIPSPPLGQHTTPESPQDSTKEMHDAGEAPRLTSIMPTLEHVKAKPLQEEKLESSRPVEKQPESLTRSHSMNHGTISFSIGSYGSYKTEAVEDIFSSEPGKMPRDRFKNIKVASSPRPTTVQEKVTVTVNKQPDMPERASRHSSPEKPKIQDCHNAVNPQVVTVSIGKHCAEEGNVGNDSAAQNTLARASSLLDLRNSALNENEPKKAPKQNESCLADEKDALLSEYAKLQLQFVAWQQQLACNQNLLENKKIVPCTSDSLNGFAERSKGASEAGMTLPRSRPHRPLSLVVEPSRTPLPGAPKIQLGSWKEHRDDSALVKNRHEEHSSSTSFKPTKSYQKHGESVAQAAAGTRTKQTDGTAKPKPLSPLDKANAKPTFKKPVGVTNLAPTVRGFSQESMSKIAEEMAQTRKDSLNGRNAKLGSLPDASAPGTKSTQNISGQNNVIVHLKPTQESTKSHGRLSPAKDDEVKPTLQDEITKSARIPSATSSDANKPSVVRATLKSGMSSAVTVSSAPVKEQVNSQVEDDKRTANGRMKPATRKEPPSPPADPREVLMNEIRSFGGKRALKKVSTEPAWQLNICNVRSAAV